MASKQLKHLTKLRLILSVIAAMLAVLMVISGAMHIIAGGNPGTDGPEETTEPSQESSEESTVPTETQATTQAPADPGEDENADKENNPAETPAQTEATTPTNPKYNPFAPKPTTVPTVPTTPSETPDTPPETPDTPPETPSTPPETPDTPPETPSTPPETPNTPPAKPDTSPAKPDTSPAKPDTSPADNNVPVVQTAANKPVRMLHAPRKAVIHFADVQREIKKTGADTWGFLFWISAALLSADLLAILFISKRMDALARARHAAGKKARSAKHPQPSAARSVRQTAGSTPHTENVSLSAGTVQQAVGTVHQIGRRSYQQDSLGHSAVYGGNGILAVLADGMGGLSDGDKVSQKVVMEMLTLGQKLTSGDTNGVLKKMLSKVNESVNQTLGASGLYKSGSTMVAVLVRGTEFQWISVGDSRIYLYRQGYVNQLNRDHDQLQVLLAEALEGKRSIEDALRNPDGRKLTSFIGMGQLRFVDASLSAIDLEPGDRLVLMSDGVYNVLGEERLAAILKQFPDVNHAASTIEKLVKKSQNPHQDNYTAIILGF